MEDERTAARTEAEQAPRPLGAHVAVWAGTAVATALLVWGALHVAVPPVDPARPAPDGHWTAPCWTCHIVTGKAP